MTATVTDLFAGAGGSSTGIIQNPGFEIRIAANHWKLVTEIHHANHPDADHAVVDLHQERPSFFPSTDVLWASPECTKWSQASGSASPAIEVGLLEDPLSDEAKNRSRLLMFDVLRFVEHHRYRLVVVENVVDIATQAKYRTAWTIWRQELRALGYKFRVVSLNSMHAQLFGMPAPQSRDRIYVVAWPEGEVGPDLEFVTRPRAFCGRCDVVDHAVQSFKPRREVGRYRQAYLFCCPRCGGVVEPGWLPAAAAIDWSLPGERIGDREKPLAEKTLARIAAGIARYWGPLQLEAAGNTYDAADPKHRAFGDVNGYYRSWPVDEAMKTLHTNQSKALAVPVEGREGKGAASLEQVIRTQTTRAETALAALPFIAEMYGTSTARSVAEAAGTFTAGGNHHALVSSYYGSGVNVRPTDDVLGTVTTVDKHALVMTNNHANRAREIQEALPTLTTASVHALVTSYYSRDDAVRPAELALGTITTEPRHALLTRHNNGRGDAGAMTTPSDEWMRTLTTTAQQSIMRKPRDVTARDLDEARQMIPDVMFRMFTPGEVAAGMAFPTDYIWQPPEREKKVSNRDLVKAAGNAVTPPSSRDILGASADYLGVAA